MLYLAVKVLTHVVFSCLSNTTCSIVAIMKAHPTMSQRSSSMRLFFTENIIPRLPCPMEKNSLPTFLMIISDVIISHLIHVYYKYSNLYVTSVVKHSLQWWLVSSPDCHAPRRNTVW